jgi:hypothetical protein
VQYAWCICCAFVAICLVPRAGADDHDCTVA